MTAPLRAVSAIALLSLLVGCAAPDASDEPDDQGDEGSSVSPGADDTGEPADARRPAWWSQWPRRDAGTARDASSTAPSGSAADASTPVPSVRDAGAPPATKPTGPCEWPEPPASVAAWVDQSWKAELGNNVRGRKAWNLDHVMLAKGSINVCVRWGATSAVPASVRDNLAPTVERWFNDWFKALKGYGCFPYGDGIKVNVVGWAVRPGKQSLLAGIDPSVPVYTQTDAEGEPMCPDACSSFVHWDHKVPSCPGGDKNRHDYALWFDDKLPGGGGAAAVGGDWGLRMPVRTFLDAFSRPSDHIIEHEMGHGFGIQDYYTWSGARPEGGSIMIVGSTNSQSPTLADQWLLRRTWKEMKTLRGW